MGIDIVFFITLLPSLLIALFFIKSDKYPEPTKEIIKVFAFGFLITIPIFFINTIIFSIIQNFSIALIPAAFVEEFFKFLIIYYVVRKSIHLDEPIDCIVYAVLVSLGFATLENFYYVYVSEFASNPYQEFYLAILRAFTAVPAHALFGSIMGYCFYKYHFENNKDYLILTILLPTIAHFFYNLLASSGFILIIIIYILSLIFINMKLLKKLKKKQE